MSSRVDEFESLFRAAAKETYRYGDIAIRTVAVVSDLLAPRTEELIAHLQKFLAVLGQGATEPVRWVQIRAARLEDLDEVMEQIDALQPDLIVTWRNLAEASWRFPYGLGAYVNVLTRHAQAPVLLLPEPRLDVTSVSDTDTNSVAVITDHLTGDQRLVDYGIKFTCAEGSLGLCHVEDEQIFQRYCDVIGKLPGIYTEDARRKIGAQLLREPREYIQSVAGEVGSQALPLSIKAVVEMGHGVEAYQTLCEKLATDLLIFRTRDRRPRTAEPSADAPKEGARRWTEAHGGLAMGGASLQLAANLREVPLLML